MNENHNLARRCSREEKEMDHRFTKKLITDLKKICNCEIKLRNSRPEGRNQYVPTELEHIANILSHGIMIAPSAYGTYLLLKKSKTSKDHAVVSLIYGSALVFLFSISFLYHCVFYENRNLRLKNFLHRLDRAMIYIFIAGSYFPFLVLEHSLKYAFIVEILKYVIWILAALGILYQQLFHERYKQIETLFYILIAFLPATLVILFGHEFLGMLELKVGGIIYLIGVIFFKCDGKLCCAHALWHIFVVIAAFIHYYAIFKYLYSDQNITEHLTNLNSKSIS